MKTQSATSRSLEACDVTLRDDLSRGGLSPDLSTRIEEALEATIIKAGFKLDQAIPPRRKPGLAMAAARKLFNEKAFEAAIVLAHSLPPSEPAFKVIIRGMEELGEFEKVRDLLASTEVRVEDNENLANYVFQCRFRYKMPMGIAEHIAHWGPVPQSMDDALRGLDEAPGMPRQFPALAACLARLRGKGETPEEVLKGLRWGHAAQNYVRFLMRCQKDIEDHEALRTETDSHPDGAAFLRLLDQIDSIYKPSAIDAVKAEYEQGRGIMVTRAHAGMALFFAEILDEIDLPMARISANLGLSGQKRKGKREGSIDLSTRGNFQMNFLKLVKSVRKRPHLINIFPDGARGGDFVECQLLGCPVQIGQGAATLAWHGKASVFFMGTEWQGMRCHGYLIQGPAPQDFDDREAFDAAFYEFYTAQLERIVMGDPRDMVGSAGFWPMLLAAEK